MPVAANWSEARHHRDHSRDSVAKRTEPGRRGNPYVPHRPPPQGFLILADPWPAYYQAATSAILAAGPFSVTSLYTSVSFISPIEFFNHQNSDTPQRCRSCRARALNAARYLPTIEALENVAVGGLAIRHRGVGLDPQILSADLRAAPEFRPGYDDLNA